jgi:hypothetical protein
MFFEKRRYNHEGRCEVARSKIELELGGVSSNSLPFFQVEKQDLVCIV